MVTLNTTPNRGYQEPAVGNTLEVDVGRLIAALRAIDVDVADALAQIVAKAGLASPAFTGTPTAPTAAPGTDSGQLATTAFVKAALAALVGLAPEALDTIEELAAASENNSDLIDLLESAVALKADAAATTAALAGKADASIAVRVDAAQSFTAAQQAQARTNISAALKGHLYGLTLTNNASDAANDIDIAAGEAASTDTDSVLMVLASALTKRLDAAWAVGSGNGGLDTGSVGNNIYYVWLIQRSDTGVVDALFSLSKTSPTMPTNYDRKALIGSFARVSAANNVPRSYSQKDAGPWVAYTPTIVGLGTPTQVFAESRREGPDLLVRGKVTSGTSAAVELRFGFGVDGANGNVVCDNERVPSIQIAGSSAFAIQFDGSPTVLMEGSTSYLTFGVQTTNRAGLTKVSGSTLLASGDSVSFEARIPIKGWN